ncbi:unnamed protein product, partial [Rotaria sp. Silwood2]
MDDANTKNSSDMKSSLNISALNMKSPQSRFNVTTPISTLVNQMMIEDWFNISSHVAFYEQCRPLICTYSYVGKNDLIVVITTIIGLISGLTTILKFLTPRVVHTVWRWFKPKTRPDVPPD